MPSIHSQGRVRRDSHPLLQSVLQFLDVLSISGIINQVVHLERVPRQVVQLVPKCQVVAILQVSYPDSLHTGSDIAKAEELCNDRVSPCSLVSTYEREKRSAVDIRASFVHPCHVQDCGIYVDRGGEFVPDISP